jgi:signal transduction histidine kinase
MELEREPTDLTTLLRDAIRVNAMLAQKKRIAIDAELDDSVGALPLDQHKILQVADNLLSNAVKFSHPDSRVRVELQRNETEAHLSVRDEGVGIPAEDLDRVFEAFQRTSARPTAGERSTGLGLAIVRSIVEAHGGRIWVESEVGVGSTFFVTLPLATAP